MTGRTAARATEAQQQYVRAVEKATKEVPAYLSEIGELDKKGRMLQDTMDKQIQLMFEKLKSNTLDAAEHARIQAEVQQNCATYVGDQQTKVDRSRKLYESVSNQVTTIDQEIVKLEKEIAEIQGKVQTGHNSIAAAAASSRGVGRGGRKAGRTAVQPMEEMPLQPPPLVPPVVPMPAIPAHFVPFTFHFPGRPAFTEYVDPHEPRYCVCKQPSQGDMIACDNNTCKIEWFHNVCVGITKAPDKWICPECRKSDGMQKRGRRQ